jgi:hypothetical protein
MVFPSLSKAISHLKNKPNSSAYSFREYFKQFSVTDKLLNKLAAPRPYPKQTY